MPAIICQAIKTLNDNNNKKNLTLSSFLSFVTDIVLPDAEGLHQLLGKLKEQPLRSLSLVS